MRRFSFQFFAAALTFAFGVIIVFVWLNYERSPVITIQADLPVASKPDPAAEKRQADVSELARNRQLWKDQNIVNYSFVAEQFAGGMYRCLPFRIKVANSRAISMKPTRKNAGLERTEGYDKFNTVEKMFDEIQAAINRGDELDVTYNKERGFPERIYFDAIGAPTDSYVSMGITEFEITAAN